MTNFKEELCNILVHLECNMLKRDQAILSITELVKKIVPLPKQVRYEDIKKEMNFIDGKIIETERNITYSKEDEAFNSCRTEILKRLEVL